MYVKVHEVHVYRVGMLFNTLFQAINNIECSGLHDLHCSKFSLEDGKRMYTSKTPNLFQQCLVQSNFTKFNYVNE